MQGGIKVGDCPKKRGSEAGQWSKVVQPTLGNGQWTKVDKSLRRYCPKEEMDKSWRRDKRKEEAMDEWCIRECGPEESQAMGKKLWTMIFVIWWCNFVTRANVGHTEKRGGPKKGSERG